MAVDIRDLVLVNMPKTVLVPMGSGVPAPTASDVSWSRTYTGTSTVTVLVENDDLLTADELAAVAEGEVQIAAGEFVTLAELEKSLDE